MIIDDSKPDYFDDEPTAPTATEPTAQTDSRHIDFGEPDTAPHSAAPSGKPRRHSRFRRVLAWIIAIAVVVLGITVYFRYFSPYVSDAQMRCYIISVEKRGIIFKTLEADVVSEQAVTDTTRLYSREQSLSVESPAVAHKLRQLQGTGRTATVSYKTYWAALPWRGASKSVITAVQP